jgi:hypothetical protein
MNLKKKKNQVRQALKKYLCIVKLCMLHSKYIKILIWSRFEHHIDPISFKLIFNLLYDMKVVQILYPG